MSSPKKKKKDYKECTKKCLGTHGKSSSALPSSVSAAPSFFKIMIGDFSEALYVPPMFAQTIVDLVDKIIYLEDSYGDRWRVKTCLVDGSLAFGYGWHNFVLDHSIRTGEFVVFKHIKKLVFSVQIFAASACERLHLCEKNERSRKRKRCRKVKMSTEMSSGKIHKNLDASEEKLCFAVKIPRKAEKVTRMIDPDTSSTKTAVGNCCNEGARGDLDQSNRPPCPTNNSEKLETASMTRFSEDFPHIVDGDAIGLEISGEIPGRNIVDMDRMVITQKDLEKEVKCECSSQDTEFLENKTSHSCRNNLRESQTALAKECKETKSNKQSQSSLAVVTSPCTNGCLTVDHSKGDTLETSVKKDMKERIGSSRPQTSYVNSPENDGGNLASSNISAHKFLMQEIKIRKQAKKDTGKLIISNNAMSFNANANDATISPGDQVAIIKKNYSPYVNQIEAPSNARAFNCSNDEMETLMSSCDNTQFGTKNVENQASENAPLVSCHKEQSRPVSSGETDPKIISNMSVLQEHSDIMEQKNSDSERCLVKWQKIDLEKDTIYAGISFTVVKTERMDPIDIQLPNHGKFGFALAVTAQSWLEFHERLPVRLGKIKHGRKVITLRDPCMRIWPVLYHESARFVGFISGWEEFTKANNLRKGHTCEFELYSSSGPTLQVHISKQ